MKGIAIYYLFDPRSGRLRYVGKSKNPIDRLRRHCKINDGRSSGTHSKRWIRQLAKQNLKPVLRIVCWAQNDEEAWRYEIALIAAHRANGEPLTNESNGGDGRGVNFRHTEKSKANIRRAMRRLKKTDPAWAEKRIAAMKKAFSDPVFKARQRAASLARYADGTIQAKQQAGWARRKANDKLYKDGPNGTRILRKKDGRSRRSKASYQRKKPVSVCF
jgi:hypothetical protein